MDSKKCEGNSCELQRWWHNRERKKKRSTYYTCWFISHQQITKQCSGPCMWAGGPQEHNNGDKGKDWISLSFNSCSLRKKKPVNQSCPPWKCRARIQNPEKKKRCTIDLNLNLCLTRSENIHKLWCSAFNSARIESEDFWKWWQRHTRSPPNWVFSV